MTVASNRTCGTEGCDRAVRAHGYCATCHSRLRRQDETRPRCTLDGCDTPQFARTLCSRHYQHARKGLIPLPDKVKPSYASPACEVDGCDKPRKGRGMCAMHYSRLMRYGYIGEADERHKPSTGLTCSDPECSRPAAKAQLCRRHYRFVRMAENPAAWQTIWCMTAQQIADRDGTDCYLCGEPVDMTAHLPDRMCPSVDHVIPRSRGGADEPHNVALAHLVCNMRKSANLPTGSPSP